VPNWTIFYITLSNLGIPVEMVQFLMKLLLKQRFLAVHHDFHFVLPAKFHFLYVKESEMWKGRSRKFWKGRSWSRIFYLRLRNPAYIVNPVFRIARNQGE